MPFRKRTVGDIDIVEFSGRITDGSEEHREKLAAFAASLGGKDQVILDLSEVMFVNTVGIGLLIAAYTRLRRDGARVVSVGFKAKPELRVTSEPWPLLGDDFETIDEAIAHFVKNDK
jgi:anti-anti-sigma factor